MQHLRKGRSRRAQGAQNRLRAPHFLVSYITLGSYGHKYINGLDFASGDISPYLRPRDAAKQRCRLVAAGRALPTRAMPAVVSSDHADESLNQSSSAAEAHRCIRPEEIEQHRSKDSFWCVVDGFVVDATAFIDTHPGGLRKLMSTDDAGIGAGPDRFSFSFSRGRNAHFPDTGRRFADGVQRYLRDGHATKIKFPPHGALVILGRLDES